MGKSGNWNRFANEPPGGRINCLNMALELHLDTYSQYLRLKKESEKDYVWDPTRERYLVLQPEEFVRQLLIQYLHKNHWIPISRMRSEYGIELHRTKKRCDLIVFDKNGRPFLMAECKSFKKMNAELTADQIERYNLEVKTDRILITNGPESHYFIRKESGGPFERVDEMDLSDFY